ncbi:hypothetical protein Trydic_g21344 [Trypoxylus dichotomus]
MQLIENLYVEQYIALFLPFCTSTLSFCCEDITYFFESLFFVDLVQNGDCLRSCAYNDPSFSKLENITEIAATLPRISYCAIECTSKAQGYIDDKGRINFDAIMELIDAEFQPTDATIEKCKNSDLTPAFFQGKKYHDAAMKFFFCFWREAQLTCPKIDQKDRKICEDLQYVLMTGEKPQVSDLQYLGLLMPVCTVFSGCCVSPNFHMSDLLSYTLQNPLCAPMCAMINRVPFELSVKGISGDIPRAAYCTIECITRRMGLIDDDGDIVSGRVLKLIQEEFKPNKQAQRECLKRDYDLTIYENQVFNNKVMKFIMCIWKHEQKKCPADKVRNQAKCNKLRPILDSEEEIDLLEILWCLLPVKGVAGNPRPWE